MKRGRLLKSLCNRCSCGGHVFIRGAHTFLVLGVPASLVTKDTVLKRALLERGDLIYGVCYVALVLASLVMYYVACLTDPGYINPNKSKSTRITKNALREQASIDTVTWLPLQNHPSGLEYIKMASNNNMKETDNDFDEDSDSTPMMSQSDNEPLIGQTSPENQEEHINVLKQRFRYCDYCEIEQPMRSKHCDDCKKCVRRHDHHCPWLDACVGECNHKYFWIFLLLTAILIMWTFAIICTSFQHEKKWTDWWEKNVFFVIDVFVLTFGGFTVLGLLGFHTFLMIRGLTTWELVSRERITYLKHLNENFNPFDEGCFLNMYHFLTRCKVQRWEATYDRKTEKQKLGIV